MGTKEGSELEGGTEGERPSQEREEAVCHESLSTPERDKEAAVDEGSSQALVDGELEENGSRFVVGEAGRKGRREGGRKGGEMVSVCHVVQGRGLKN